MTAAVVPLVSFDWVDLALKLGGGVVAAVVAAVLTARFTVNRFYKEKWWEKRLTSFTEVIDLAYRIKMTNRYFTEVEYLKIDEKSPDFTRHPKDIENALIAEYWAALQEIERISQLSEFTLTSKASAILNKFISQRQSLNADVNNDAIFDIDAAERDLKFSVELLDALVSEAKRELKIPH